MPTILPSVEVQRQILEGRRDQFAARAFDLQVQIEGANACNPGTRAAEHQAYVDQLKEQMLNADAASVRLQQMLDVT